ncbi:uncharacterized protein LOC131333018 [Rhododendron vialii]|uniref:uncharacterized protein LOC131333018 n=1 Tax=Rhododendron vialii TaxID=182163 RepID=UPI00265EE75E|nr:uncharacterized protein LOC131333018 [Rhododendron vialii]
MGSVLKKKFVSKIIKKRKPDLLFIQETKLENVDLRMVQKIWGNTNVEFAVSNSIGASGGILILWDFEVFKASNITVHKSYIILEGMLYGDFQCVLVNIYAPNGEVQRKELWDELLQIKASSQLPWCVGGDLNEIIEIDERVGCTNVNRGMREFKDFINNMELMDIPMQGRKFTWTNFQDLAIHSRLDRFLLSQSFIDRFKLVQWGLPRPISDHNPIMIADDCRDWGPKPFRFMDIWLTNPNCLKVAKEAWESCQVYGWAGFVIVQKLRAVKNRLKQWNKEDFGNVFTGLESCQETIYKLDLVAEDRQLH